MAIQESAEDMAEAGDELARLAEAAIDPEGPGVDVVEIEMAIRAWRVARG